MPKYSPLFRPPSPQAASNLAAQYGNLLRPLQAEREKRYQADVMRSQVKGAKLQALGGIFTGIDKMAKKKAEEAYKKEMEKNKETFQLIKLGILTPVPGETPVSRTPQELQAGAPDTMPVSVPISETDISPTGVRTPMAIPPRTQYRGQPYVYSGKPVVSKEQQRIQKEERVEQRGIQREERKQEIKDRKKKVQAIGLILGYAGKEGYETPEEMESFLQEKGHKITPGLRVRIKLKLGIRPTRNEMRQLKELTRKKWSGAERKFTPIEKMRATNWLKKNEQEVDEKNIEVVIKKLRTGEIR